MGIVLASSSRKEVPDSLLQCCLISHNCMTLQRMIHWNRINRLSLQEEVFENYTK